MRRYHAVVWDEPIIFEMCQKGARGHIVPEVEEQIAETVGDVKSHLPAHMIRKHPPNLPELSEPEVMTHYLHMSQQTFGFDSGIIAGIGTCTMKYSPKVNEQLARMPQMTDVHPLQDEETVQGILEIMYYVQEFLCEITGMNEVNLQPSGGSHGVYTNCCMMRAYHNFKKQLPEKSEVIVPILSHPCNAAASAFAGFKVVDLYPDEDTGCPDIEAVKSAVSRHTAGMLLTDPYDTGIFDSQIEEYVKIVHEAGGLVLLDQANANGILGVVRAGDVGADMCQLNLHKTFSSPHGSEGPGSGAVAVKEDIKKFMPVPVVEFDGEKYRMNYDRPLSIGKIRSFFGNVQVALRAYAWIMALGSEGILDSAKLAVLNNNYMMKRLSQVRGITLPYAKHRYRLQETRFSWEQLSKDTGVTTDDISNRMMDYGVSNYFSSHHPMIVPEPMTPEPTESISKTDIDRFCEIVNKIVEEAYSNPQVVKTAPHNCAISRMDMTPMHDASRLATTWNAFLKRKEKSH